MVKKNKKKRTQKQMIADLEKTQKAWMKDMEALAKNIVDNVVKIKETTVELAKNVNTLLEGVSKAMNDLAKSVGDEMITLDKSLQKVEKGFERIQGVIEEKMFYASEDAKKLTKSEKKKPVTPDKLKAPVPGIKKDIPYTTKVRQFKELEGLKQGLYEIIVAGRFGSEIRVKPYDKTTQKNYVSEDKFRELAQALTAKGFGRKPGYEGYFSNKIKPQEYRNNQRGRGYRRDRRY